VVWQMQFFE